MEAKNPVIIVGTNALNRADGSSLHGLCATISNSLKSKGKVDSQWRVLNVLHRVNFHLFIFAVVNHAILLSQ